MPTLRITTVCFSAIAALAGCNREAPVAVQLPETHAQKTPLTTQADKTPSHRTFARTQSPAGNDKTRRFLAWAHEQFPLYCAMELDSNGDCVVLNIHPCWPTKDDELKKISELKQIQSLSLYATSVTDDGLRHLENMPALKKLWMMQACQLTDDGLERLKRANPELKIDLPSR